MPVWLHRWCDVYPVPVSRSRGLLLGVAATCRDARRSVLDWRHGLRSLTAAHSPLLSDAGAGMLARAFAHLASLDLSYCWRVGDGGVRSVARQLRQLTTLRLRHCDRVGDIAARAIASAVRTCAR